ncbi:hypothetical protein [Tissierella sp.]|uniref:hypothetical protein n=1 Tax=Tissierella sp. TaxID=41274 RepID=UPI00285A1248|nr:hypothetical protein [Tissierella sp.]MDR7856632.1 hypothetical protein [Tissierella sp.]
MKEMDCEMRKLYSDIEVELDKVNFNDIWSGFSRTEFAIYNKSKVFLKDDVISHDERFLGNTSIDYNGDKLAIWYIEDTSQENIEELASNIVHEMFHSYQFLNNESRFPNDLKGLDYPMDLKNYEIKYRENMLLVEALSSNDRNLKYDMLKEIIGLRIFRLQNYGDIIKYEFAIETVEGSAEYCGAKALRQISKEVYEKRIERYKRILSKDISKIFDIRRSCYYSGTLFLLLLEDLDISFTHEIHGQHQHIFEEVADKVGYSSIKIDDIKNLELERYYIEYKKETEKKFEDFFNQSFEKYKGDFYICGYDPMNMIKHKDKILCSHCIFLEDKVENKKIFLKGPLVVKLEKGTSNHVIEYYLKKIVDDMEQAH